MPEGFFWPSNAKYDDDTTVKVTFVGADRGVATGMVICWDIGSDEI